LHIIREGDIFMVILVEKYRYSIGISCLAAVLSLCLLFFGGCRTSGSDSTAGTETAVHDQTGGAEETDSDLQDGAASEAAHNGGEDTDPAPDTVTQAAGGESQSSETTPGTGGAAASDTNKVYIKDVAYVEGDSARTMDIMYEKDGSLKPVLLLVHGGSYIEGDKSEMTAYQNYYYKKYLTISINYPLLPNATMVSQYRCVEQALAFLADHAEQFDADMQKVVLIGFSAGAQLAVRAGEEIMLRVSYGEELPYSVIGIVDNAGPTDEKTIGELSSTAVIDLASKYPQVIDGVKDSDLATELAKIDCTTNIVRGMSPVLIIHGSADTKVDYRVSVAFYDALKEQDVDVTFKLFEGQEHGVDLTLVIPCISEFIEKVTEA
jgi:acetyl esterase/lipase